MGIKTYKKLSYKGLWNRWKRHPDKYPHPPLRRKVNEPKIQFDIVTKKCITCPRRLSLIYQRKQCPTCLRKKNVVLKDEIPKPLYCWSCCLWLKEPVECPRCSAPFDQKKSDQTAKRQGMSFKDHVKAQKLAQERSKRQKGIKVAK